jgi:hypothetical protein
VKGDGAWQARVLGKSVILTQSNLRREDIVLRIQLIPGDIRFCYSRLWAMGPPPPGVFVTVHSKGFKVVILCNC